MKTKSRKRAYVKPECRVIATETERLLQGGSGNAGTIGGNGGGYGDAKQGWFEEEEEEGGFSQGSSSMGTGSLSVWEE